MAEFNGLSCRPDISGAVSGTLPAALFAPLYEDPNLPPLYRGAIQIFAAFDLLASRIVSIIICVLLLVVIVLAKNWLPRVFNPICIAIFCVLWWLSTTTYDPEGLGLRITTLWFGTMSCCYACWDIIEDLVG